MSNNPEPHHRPPTAPLVLHWLTFLSMLAGLYLALLYAPREQTMGDAQRIFYLHVPAAWVGFLAFAVTLVASVLYLRHREPHWDIVAACSAEIGVVFTAIAVITGSIWAKPTWNAWWPWQQEPRLILVTILLLIYLAYLMLRSFLPQGEQRARLAAVYGIAAFASVPLTFLSVRWWQGLHPVIFERRGIGLTTPMLQTFLVCLGAFTLLYGSLLQERIKLAQLTSDVELLRVQLLDAKRGVR